jgi:hypothetical protein
MKAKKEDVVVGDALQTQAQSLDAHAVQHGLHIDAMTAKRAVSAGVSFVMERRSQLEKILPGVDFAQVEELTALCDRYAVANQEAVDSRRVHRGPPSRRLMAGMREWRHKLLPVAAALVSNGKLEASQVDKLRSGQSALELVTDVLSLTALLAPHRAVVEVTCGESVLDAATLEANAALGALGAPTPANEVTDLRDRYATLLSRGHDRLRTLVCLLSTYREAGELVGPLTRHVRRKVKTEPASPTP